MKNNILNVSATAIAAIRECTEDKNTRPTVRIYVKPGSCSGPNLRLNLDEEKENDHAEDHDGMRFVVDNRLLADCGGSIAVDYNEPEKDCCCSDGCGGFQISGKLRFLFTERCRLEQCNGTCRCDAPVG